MRKSLTVIFGLMLIACLAACSAIAEDPEVNTEELKQLSADIATGIYRLDIESSREHLSAEAGQQAATRMAELRELGEQSVELADVAIYSMEDGGYQSAAVVRSGTKVGLDSENFNCYVRWDQVGEDWIITAYQDAVLYDCPLSLDSVRPVLDKYGLNWDLEETRSWADGQQAHLFNDENGNKIGAVNSTGRDGIRFLEINGYPATQTNDTVPLSQLETMFSIAGELYGNPQACSEVYTAFNAYLAAADEYTQLYMTQRIMDDHITIRLYKEQNNEFAFNRISIMNTESYEFLQQSAVKVWKSRATSEVQNNLDLLENIRIPELPRDRDYGLILTGALSDIEGLEELPVYIAPGKPALPSSQEHLLQAVLSNDTGSIPVILKVTTHTEEELAEERNHYIYYLAQDDVFVIELIVKR